MGQATVPRRGRDQLLPVRPRQISHPFPYRTRPFPDGVKVWHECPEAIIDICFVHGLTGDRDRTWTAHGQPDPWPQILLPPMLPRARIITFGYDAYVVRNSTISNNRLIDHATNLVVDLTSDRASCNASSRPLILVAHSLGGLVCKEAVLLSRNNPELHLQSLFESVIGIVFMGTPHKGSWMADWATIPASALQLIKSTNRSLLAVLQTDNQLLNSIQVRFLAMVRELRENGRHFEVTCFYEELAFPSVKRAVVTKESATLEGYISLSIHGNHRDMVRFGSSEVTGFKRLAGVLRRWEGLVREVSSQQARPQTGVMADEAETRHLIIPFGRNKDFVGRKSILARLLEVIPPSADEEDCQRTVVEGLGGVGKTQIAVEAAFRVRSDHRDCSIFWVPAVDAATFENAYREIGRQLKVVGIDEEKANVKELVQGALSRMTGSWLLIIDNADDNNLLFNPAGPTALCDYLPFSLKGSILFTTRNDEVASKLDIPRKKVLSVPEMSRDESICLLQKNLKEHQTSDTESMITLLHFLTDLPLAIRQASAYMAKTGITVSEYLGYCQTSDASLIELLSKDFGDRTRYKSSQNPVATTWLISFRHIARDNPLASQYLQFMAFLAEKEIPKALLPPGQNGRELDEAIGMLKAYTFVNERPDQEAYDVHRLVRLAMRNWVSREGKLEMCVKTILERLDQMFPFGKYKNRADWSYLPHVISALGFADNAMDKKTKRRLLSNIAEGDYLLWEYTISQKLHQQVLEVQTRILGAEDPSTLVSMHNVAYILGIQGRYEEAETMHRQILEVRTRVLSAGHPNILTSMSNLALVLSSQGKHEEAEAMQRQELELSIKVLGAEHPDTLTSMGNLAIVLDSQGKHDEAEAIHRQELELSIKALGAEYPDTLTRMGNLAIVLDSQGKHDEAEAICRRELELSIKVLGADHPGTLASMSNLATVLDNQGKHDEAEAICRQELELSIKVLGADHPDTLIRMGNSAIVLDSQGKHDKAEAMHRRTLEGRIKVLGADHPDTLSSKGNLEICLIARGGMKSLGGASS